jgi:hypothetical protein
MTALFWETVSQCHPDEVVAEGSRIYKSVQSLDSAPAAQNDIRVIFFCDTVSRAGGVEIIGDFPFVLKSRSTGIVFQ